MILIGVGWSQRWWEARVCTQQRFHALYDIVASQLRLGKNAGKRPGGGDLSGRMFVVPLSFV